MDKQFIKEVFNKHATDKGTRLHNYEFMYSEVFENAGPVAKMLEIGVKRGQSLAAWCELFPYAEIVGVDIKPRNDMVTGFERATVHVANSMSEDARPLIGDGYSIIIDDGDHRPDAQWGTFLNLQDAWTTAYVIEDVIGLDNEKMLRRRLKSRGFTNIVTYSSKLNKASMMMNGVETEFAFYAMVIYKQ